MKLFSIYISVNLVESIFSLEQKNPHISGDLHIEMLLVPLLPHCLLKNEMCYTSYHWQCNERTQNKYDKQLKDVDRNFAA
ncbi:Uncharacterised protein [Vibrio anguillarum]|nr:Uncharacterised protein [Vibrio anguillarum]